jgi:sugar/nucleoside kinase (ribokinase family)
MLEREFDIITIGDTCVDLIMDLGQVLPRFGQVEQWVPDYFAEMGGSACIFACQAARLGLRVAVLGRVGDDLFGHLILQRLRECGVDTRYMSVVQGLKTGLGVALCRPGGDRAILTHAGSLNAVYPADVTDAFLASGRHFHYCSYYLQTNLLPAIPEIVRRARALGLTISLDTNWDPDGRWDGGLRAILPHVDLFFPNEQEAIAIAQAADLAEAVATLTALGPVVVVKRGENGALLADGQARHQVPVAVNPDPVDTIGAGDSFDAGFLAGWLRGLPLLECTVIANLCGHASTTARGGVAGQLTAADLPMLGRVQQSTPNPPARHLGPVSS